MSGLHPDRVPASVDEAREMAAYNERILATSQSSHQRERATRMLANLKPHLERLEREERARVAKIETATPPASTIKGQIQRRVRDREDDYEVVWSGGQKDVSLTGRWDSKQKNGFV